jgi:uridine phosphorylase
MSLPRDSSKYDKKSFVEPSTFVNYVQKMGRLPKLDVPKNILFFFIPTQIPRLDNVQKMESKKFFDGKIDLLGNNVGIVSQFGFGAPALTIQLELLIAMGAQNFIGVGQSGSLSEKLKVGDFVLCNQAVRDEGVSQHYVPPAEYAYPDESLCKKIRQEFKSRNLPFHEEPTWTTDAIYRETVDEVKTYREKGVCTVDMEASALFSVARYRKVKAASLFAISDLLTGDTWEPHFHTTAPPLKTLVEVAIASLAR